MKRLLVTMVLGLSILAADAGAFASSARQFELYAFLLTIDNSDKRGDVVQTVRGAESVFDLIEGRDPETFDDGETIFNRYVLKPSLIPGAPEITVIGMYALNTSVPAVVRQELFSGVAFRAGGLEFGQTSNVDRAEMQRRLRQRAGEVGVTHIWEIVPGDDLSAGPDLRSRFVPRFAPVP